MNEDLDLNRRQITTIDQEQIKMISGLIKKYSSDLETVRERADLLWESCETYLDPSIINSIDYVKNINKKRYSDAIEELNNYANKIESIANIWNETEQRIKSSSIELEKIFSEIGKTISSITNNKN